MLLVFILGAGVLFCLYRYQNFFQYGYHAFWIDRRLKKYLETHFSIVDRLSDVVQKRPNKPFVYFKDECFTFKQAHELSNKTARVFLQSGVCKGDVVAIFSPNCPMFIWVWLGLVKIGCVGAFINFNIRSKSLLHCLKISGAKILVAAEGKVCKFKSLRV